MFKTAVVLPEESMVCADVLYQNGNATDGFDNHYAGGLESKTTGSILVTAYASNLVDAFTCDLIVMGDLA